LIYEVVGGKPIYYKGYKDVLNKTKTIEEITMESQLQSGLKAALSAVLYFLLKKLGYQLATGELGINISKTGKRGADLAIYKAENWEWKPNFSNLPPEIVIEIDVQAELEGITEMDYISTKIKDYLEFGVKKVIWIFTKQQLIFVATSQLPWLTYDWSAEIEVVEGVTFKLNDMIKAE
jgi:Uma2 family endonuclease